MLRYSGDLCVLVSIVMRGCGGRVARTRMDKCVLFSIVMRGGKVAVVETRSVNAFLLSRAGGEAKPALQLRNLYGYFWNRP